MKTSGSKHMNDHRVSITVATFVFVAVLLINPGLSAVAENTSGKRFIVDRETVVDTSTGLMWAVRDNGYDINWQDSKEFCEKFTGNGFSDWRMPTQDELASIYSFDPQSNRDYSIFPFFQITGSCLWGSDTKKATVAIFDYYYGSRDWGHPNSIIEARVLPVRKVK